MKKPKKWLPRNVRKFKKIEPDERRNPASLRRLIFDLIYNAYGRSSTHAAETLSALLRQAKGKHAFRRSFGGESLYKVVIDRQTVSYRQLDAMALHYKMPLGLLLLFSRIRSEVEAADDHHIGEARRILSAVRAALVELETRLPQLNPDDEVFDQLDHQAFIAFREAYVKEYDGIFKL
jgi:hypothetical protein